MNDKIEGCMFVFSESKDYILVNAFVRYVMDEFFISQIRRAHDFAKQNIKTKKKIIFFQIVDSVCDEIFLFSGHHTEKDPEMTQTRKDLTFAIEQKSIVQYVVNVTDMKKLDSKLDFCLISESCSMSRLFNRYYYHGFFPIPSIRL
jgi:hypothetical protein